ncbi:MAG TPA: radical SAM family heme chaperone HemW [Clostridia bacterium]|jgi:oxygen-independent coproporphyrinogen-3 oxidase|nr:radical SAM family heme chaperone HemW [Clostridia bacterium]
MGQRDEKRLPNIEALYIHIPFCRKKCFYCDFVSFPPEGLPVQEYCQALVVEGEMYQKLLPKNQKEIKSIYIGGGTPTCLPASSLVKIITRMENLFPLARGGEITVECNPGTVDKVYMSMLKRAGVNRLSVGAQSFDRRLLQEMGRIHGRNDILETVSQAKEAGFANINLDLIYGLPGQTMRQWFDTLSYAASLPVTHLSVYGLKLSEQSFWGRSYLNGDLNLPDEDMSAEMQELAMDLLESKGFIHYEIANFARPGFFSVHNRVYWDNGNYLGIGLAASSHFENRRQTNCAALNTYLAQLEQGKFPVGAQEILDRETEMGETVFLGLRILDGLSFHSFQQRYGVDFRQRYENQIEKLKRLGLVEYDNDRIKLTKKGIFLANEVFLEFLP